MTLCIHTSWNFDEKKRQLNRSTVSYNNSICNSGQCAELRLRGIQFHKRRGFLFQNRLEIMAKGQMHCSAYIVQFVFESCFEYEMLDWGVIACCRKQRFEVVDEKRCSRNRQRSFHERRTSKDLQLNIYYTKGGP